MKEIIEKLAKFQDLSSVEMTDVIERIVTGRVTEAQIASLLLALKMKGETPEERTAIAQNEYKETINKAKSMTRIGELRP